MIPFFLFFPTVIFLFLFTFLQGSLFAQALTERERALEFQLQQEIQKSKELELKLLEQAFEQAIDPNEYVVGPGDYLLIDLGADIQKSFQLPVTPEGMLVIPTVGSISVDGLTLRATQIRVEEAVNEKYLRADISTFLIGLRKIRVHVAGNVLNAGTYVATPLDRVADLIFRAGGFKQYAYLEQLRIKHKDKTESFIDFTEFQRKGDLDHNPLVKSGDIIVVDPIDYSKSLVKVEGFLSRPGYYPLKSSEETVFDFLSRHNLLTNNQDITEIAIVRETGEIILVDITKPTAKKTILKNGNMITLPRKIRHVYVVGAVLKPGMYQYVENLQAKDYVGQAGATAEASGMSGIQVFHRELGSKEKGEDVIIQAGDFIEVPIRNSKKIAEYLQIASQLGTLIIAYFAITNNPN